MGNIRVTAPGEPTDCPLCGVSMGVQKTVRRLGQTLKHGRFEARETVHACLKGCRGPLNRRITRRSSDLSTQLLPHTGVGYDVMTYIGIKRYLHFNQRREIRQKLQEQHDVILSDGEISRLCRLFLVYLETLHESRSETLRQAMEKDGGWPMHIDATGENGRGTLLVALDGWRKWVLGSWKISTEHADAILPNLRTVVTRFGMPRAIVRDLGAAMSRAAMDLVREQEADIPILACHLHFLADVGKDLLEPAHSGLRELFRSFNIRAKLRKLARDLGRVLGSGIGKARIEILEWQKAEEHAMIIPKGKPGLAIIRALAQWVLDYPDDGSDRGIPFDRPYLDLYKRCLQAGRALVTFSQKPPQDQKVCKTIKTLQKILAPCGDALIFGNDVRILEQRASLFEELRATLRLTPKSTRRNNRQNLQPISAKECSEDLHDIQKNVLELESSLRKRRPLRGPTRDLREAIDLILNHLDVHGNNLWGHAVKAHPGPENTRRLVDRTNNAIEGLFHVIKRGERRRSGRKVLTNDLETMPAAAALVRNLEHPDYVAHLCGSLENLPNAFSQLDAGRGQQPFMKADTETIDPTATASMPREDRAIVRSEGMQKKIRTAAAISIRSSVPQQHFLTQPS